jgi:hypothetical protein
LLKRSISRRVASVLLCASLSPLTVLAKPRHAHIDSLSKNAREIFLTSMQWGDESYDPETHLCRPPASLFNGEYRGPHPSGYFMVRESAWYALGLLLRDQPGDRDRAAAILRAVLAAQYHEPGKVWDGTFRRSPNEPEPGRSSVMWRAYDPNWREFVGTTLAMILIEYRDRIPADLAPKLISAIDDAVAGEMKQGRLVPTYTNPALMYAFLWNYAAVHGNHSEWMDPATKWQEEVYRLFKQHDAFFEYNSPTYAGVDFFALALWRDYGLTPRMARIGNEMEAALWRTTADLYNANLRNISGPYDRSYGMDMQRYVSLTGVWLRTVLDADHAPLTAFNPPVDHVDDLWFVPPIVILDAHIPDDAMKIFYKFPGEHSVRRPIADRRVATAWIGGDLIYGGEITGHTRGVEGTSQFHPVTVQWQAPSGKIGWIQLTRCPPIDASADKNGIVISTSPGDISFRIDAPGLTASDTEAGNWRLPGLTVHVDTDGKDFKTSQQGQFADLTYTSATRMVLTFTRTKD